MKAKQKGAVLILMAFIIGLAATAYLVTSLNAINSQTNKDKKTYQVLAEAKKALLAYAMSNSDANPNFPGPGQLPFPDRNSDGNYDGLSDCNSPTSSFTYALLIGQLPVLGQSNPCIAPQAGLGSDFKDSEGNRLWYAVSRNLIHQYENSAPLPKDPIINPSIITNPKYLWLKVFDANGRLLSDRVAAVIIAPQNVIGDQNRSVNAPSASEFLDTLKIGTTTFSNADYDTADEDFIAAADSNDVSSSDNIYEKPYNFNDKLVYITIDELIAATTSRAAAEAKNLLTQYNKNNGHYPYAASLGSSLNNNVSVDASQAGILPIDVTDSCSCASNKSCSCSFSLISSVTFTRGGTALFRYSGGNCSYSGAACTCSGAGYCSRNDRSSTNANANTGVFVCDGAGVCTHNIGGSTNRYDFTTQDYADIPSAGSVCSVVSGKARCNGVGSFNIGLKESAWFKTNLWQDYFYYQWSATPNLQVGNKAGISALLIGTGQRNVSEVGKAQNRPSTTILDYLDSTENTNGDNVFDALNKHHNDHYNDQPFIINP